MRFKERQFFALRQLQDFDLLRLRFCYRFSSPLDPTLDRPAQVLAFMVGLLTMSLQVHLLHFSFASGDLMVSLRQVGQMGTDLLSRLAEPPAPA